MASLLGSLPNSSDRDLPYEFSKPPASRTLLNLDCSADLTSYSRSLGPVLPDHKTGINDETVRAHIEDTRDHILRSRESSYRPSPQLQAQALGYPPSSHHASVPTNVIIGPTPRPQPAQFLLQRSLSSVSTPALPQSPDPADHNTWPPALNEALDKSSRHPAEAPYSNVIFQIIEHMDSQYMEDWTNIVDTYTTLHDANLAAAKHFISEYGGCFSYENPEFELDRNGYLEMKIMTDGSTGGLASVYTQRSTVKDGRRR